MVLISSTKCRIFVKKRTEKSKSSFWVNWQFKPRCLRSIPTPSQSFTNPTKRWLMLGTRWPLKLKKFIVRCARSTRTRLMAWCRTCWLGLIGISPTRLSVRKCVKTSWMNLVQPSAKVLTSPCGGSGSIGFKSARVRTKSFTCLSQSVIETFGWPKGKKS